MGCGRPPARLSSAVPGGCRHPRGTAELTRGRPNPLCVFWTLSRLVFSSWKHDLKWQCPNARWHTDGKQSRVGLLAPGTVWGTGNTQSERKMCPGNQTESRPPHLPERVGQGRGSERRGGLVISGQRGPAVIRGCPSGFGFPDPLSHPSSPLLRLQPLPEPLSQL